MYEIKLLPIKKVHIPKGGGPLSTSTVANLMDSIREEGMYNPIVVRPDPERPGEYLIVQGRNRYTAKKRLKEEFIECRIFEDMSAEEAELAATTENAIRTIPKGTKRHLLIQKWLDLFQRQHTGLVGKRAGGTARARQQEQARARKKAAEQAEAGTASGGKGSQGHRDPCCSDSQQAQATETQAEERPNTFNQRVQAATGQRETMVKRDIRIANGFTKEQLEVLDPLGIGDLKLHAILKVTKDNKNQRAEIVNLVCAGMPVADAIKEVTGITEVKDLAGRTKKAATDAEAGSEKAEAEDHEVTNDEWFETHCGEFADRLGDPDRYLRDALLYRQVLDARTAFRKKVKEGFETFREHAKGKTVGPFFFMLHKMLNLSHPRGWFYCDVCRGGGQDGQGGACRKCHGAGYFTTTERYP